MHLRTSDLAVMSLGFGGYTCNWGTHFCGLYESEAERDLIMFGYLAQGLRERELLVCCPDEKHYDHALDSVHALCPDVERPDPDSFRLFHSHELYYPEGHFSPQDMLKAHNDIWDENLQNGERNVRGTAEMLWALTKIPGIEHLMAYESLLNTFIWGKAWISICLYDVNRFPGSTIMKVLQVHPFVITGGGIYENPYFVRPEQWLAEHAPEFLQILESRL
ncbi:MAG: MEDS domain-containing protein [Smithellaceae bacterium]|nr:MEDS domain-containing protein [Smithellaceae bacterium]